MEQRMNAAYATRGRHWTREEYSHDDRREKEREEVLVPGVGAEPLDMPPNTALN